MNVAEKAAYIKGLMDGLSINTESGEGKVLKAMADLLEDISLSILDLEDETATLNEYVEELDEDLGEAEEELYSRPPFPHHHPHFHDDFDCEDCEDYDDCVECDDNCCECDDDCCDDDDDDCDCECFELECPACGNPVYIDECDIDDIDQLECPSCGKVLQLVETDEEDEEETEE